MSNHEESDAESTHSHEAPQQRKETIPDAVDSFLGKLLENLKTRNITEINRLYEEKFNELTNQHYTKKKWPSVEAVKETDKQFEEPLFLILYQELYYRHIFSRLNPTYEDRKGSWTNYCNLLDLIIDDLEAQDDLSVGLPSQWIWDMLDEFIYHYQKYCVFRSRAVKNHDVQEIKDNPDVFETRRVLTYLHKLIRYTKIEEYLAHPDNPNNISGGPFTDETTRYLGYFGLVQLLRMHSLLADYHLAMQTIECIDFDAEVPLFYSIPACHVTLYYYMGFAYLMMRRYVDAIKTFSDILVFLSKTVGVNNLSYQFDVIMKKQDHMYYLLVICIALCPRPVDESLEKHIRNHAQLAEKQVLLQRGEEPIFIEAFNYACPKFVSAALSDVESSEGLDWNEAQHRQLQLFLKEVKQQQSLPRLGSYMKLYTAIKTSKLAQLCEMDVEGLRDQLMCVMHKTQQSVRRKGPPLDGETQLCSEVEFYLDGDMVHINAQKTERAHTDVFLEQILKFQELLRKIGKP